MKNLGVGTLAGGLLTAPLMGIMYLFDEMLGLPFVPFDLFDWMTRVLPGPIVTFGIDLMIDILRQIGVSVADTAKTAERVIAVLQFFALGAVAAGLFFAFVSYRGLRPGLSAGIVVGALVGLPLVAMSIDIGGSDVEPTLVVLWLLTLFLAWGVLIRTAYLRLAPQEIVAAPSVGQPGAAVGVDRRQFLIRMGAATATITVASSGLGNLLARAASRELEAELAAAAEHQPGGIARSPFPNADDPLMPTPGTRPE